MAASIRELHNLEDWEKEWNNFENTLTKLKEVEYEKLMKLMDEYHNAQTKLKKSVEFQTKNLKAFSVSLKSIGKNVGNSKNKEKLMIMSSRMEKANDCFRELRQALPKTAGWFLRACIGEINVSLFWDKNHYKEVYERFKLRTMIFAFILGLLNIFFLPSKFFDSLFNAILVWYYSSLTLQEQILRANGSRIKGWYVTHHYLSILVSGFLLIWPASVTYQLFRTQFYIFVLYLSFVQILQYYYQQGILYRQRALGRATSMAITEEGFRKWMLQGLGFIVPFLIVGYIFQFYNSYTLYMLSRHPKCKEWQVLASSILFFLLAVGNSCTLFIVIRQKITAVAKLPCG
ncbi:ion channel TACAN isoform X2 [Hydra vulgaris]|uniref:Ion channel TACAN isoform X2 n=1 Tax=Hydra vulgaris TaxID=6087 RepID=A0ABM4CNG0_HYDVU